VTIDPMGGGALPPSHGGKDPAEILPPRRVMVDASSDNEHQTYVLGSATPVTISGVLKDSLANFLTNYRVVALGRWDTHAPLTEVSSGGCTADGTYWLQLSDGIVGPVELVARPYGELTAAELVVSNVEPVGPQTRNIAQPSGLGSRVDLTIKVEGLGADGV